ncbi:calcium-binding protein [Microtetraspora fusca]|uniref:Calcium-binding protein n=1 Tax=Microtetraspora fusca TaxID=1997 RepID=A0ABW6VJE5_MICFU|nr:calcium-binding protein [Microtetraspora fusca]
MTRRPPKEHLDELIEQVIVDAYTDEEQLSSFQMMIGDNLAVPFETNMLGLQVTVTAIDFRVGSGIVAICRHGRQRQAIGILDLPLPDPPPAGAEWIDAYRRWAG